MIQRTTVAAEEEDLETLRNEARLQGVSLATLAGRVLADKAAELRREKRPRVGVGRSGAGVAQESVDNEDLPAAQ